MHSPILYTIANYWSLDDWDPQNDLGCSECTRRTMLELAIKKRLIQTLDWVWTREIVSEMLRVLSLVSDTHVCQSD